MTPDEFLDVAKRGGLVEWTRSLKVEKLFKGHKGARNICAQNILTRQVHPIRPRTSYYCREIRDHEMVRLGQLLP